VSTWIVTSSGTMSYSIRVRMKSKSVWLADGNPTSISLYPIRTSSWNIRRLRSMDIGSISAWLPSRRSTAHQRGARVTSRVGHCRSGSETSNCLLYGAYRWIGIRLPRCWAMGSAVTAVSVMGSGSKSHVARVLRKVESERVASTGGANGARMSGSGAHQLRDEVPA
jgi:hypothetical protein